MQLVPLHHGDAAQNISAMYTVGAGGVARSKRRAMQWLRKAADLCVVQSCVKLAHDMYEDWPHASEVGHVEVEATGVAMSAADMEGHDVPPEVLKSVGHWLQKGCVTGGPTPLDYVEEFRREALRGVRIASTTGARSWAIGRTSKCARGARSPGTVPMRARNRTGVSTRQRAAQLQVY
jgi:TPR repeat protein